MKNDIKKEIMKTIISNSITDDGTEKSMSSINHSMDLAEDLIRLLGDISIMDDTSVQRALEFQIDKAKFAEELPKRQYQLQSNVNNYLVDLQKRQGKKIVEPTFNPNAEGPVPVDPPLNANFSSPVKEMYQQPLTNTTVQPPAPKEKTPADSPKPADVSKPIPPKKPKNDMSEMFKKNKKSTVVRKPKTRDMSKFIKNQQPVNPKSRKES